MDWWNETKQQNTFICSKIKLSTKKKTIKRFEFTYTALVIDEYWSINEKDGGEKANKNDF